MAGGGDGASDSVPMEDAVQALIDHFVSDLLPIRPSTSEPPDDHQLLIAKQMHLVVLLYNYYHRKQFPELEFLGFEAFCKVAVISKPSLLSYLKFMRRCREEPGDLDKQLSVAEKMVRDACNICKSLDASNDLPTMGSWPISKITVFLVDAMKEKCLLQFCTIAPGVWSLVEKDLDRLYDDLVCRSQMKNHMSDKKISVNGSQGNRSSEIEDALNQLALSIAEEKTGINKSNLSVLEHHTTYSLSQEKTTARLYIMMYTKAVNKELMEVPIKDALSSLRGTLFKKGTCPEVTPVVDYCYLLPYVNILSDWLSRPPNITNSSTEQDRLSTMSVQESDKPFQSAVTRDITGGYKPPSITDSSMELDRPATMSIQEINDKPLLKAETKGIPSDEKNMTDTAEMNEGADGTFTNVLTEALHKKADSSFQTHQEQLSHHVEDIRVGQYTRLEGQNGEKDMTSYHIPPSGSKNKEAMVDQSKKLSSMKTFNGEPLSRTVTTDAVQDRNISCDFSLVPQFTSKNHDSFRLVTVPNKSDLLQASLRILHKKLAELCQQQRLLEEEVARYEMSIHTILNGGENTLESNAELIIEACGDLYSSQTREGGSVCFELRQPQKIKRRRLSEAVLSLQSPCQELDDICSENSWILPRYSVLPSIANGAYQANITLQGMDFEFTGSGNLKSSPREARESAASHMLSKLRSIAGQAQ